MNTAHAKALITLLLATFIIGCSSRQVFSTIGRNGDTVVLPIGSHYDLERSQLSATIQECAGTWPTGIDTSGTCVTPINSPIVYDQGDPRIRAVTHMAPDIISKIIVERETAGMGVGTMGRLLENVSTQKDKEYIETFLMFDLPTTLTASLASITLTSTGGELLNPLAVEIVPGTGSSNTFQTWEFNLNDNHLQAFERASHYTITFTKDTGVQTPYAIQVDLAHNLTDQDLIGNGGTGVAFASNPRGDIKNLAWSDGGTSMRVILTPAWMKGTAPGSGEAMSEMAHFKFYVAGGVTGLRLADPTTEVPNGFMAFDIDGQEINSGIHINIE